MTARMIALLEAQRAGLYARQYWLPNIVAGIIAGVVALPLAMASAIASGARPQTKLRNARVLDALGPGDCCDSLDEAIGHAVQEHFHGANLRDIKAQGNERPNNE